MKKIFIFALLLLVMHHPKIIAQPLAVLNTSSCDVRVVLWAHQTAAGCSYTGCLDMVTAAPIFLAATTGSVIYSYYLSDANDGACVGGGAGPGWLNLGMPVCACDSAVGVWDQAQIKVVGTGTVLFLGLSACSGYSSSASGADCSVPPVMGTIYADWDGVGKNISS
jgi:hypothetical protein